jgi:hypothetical protein
LKVCPFCQESLVDEAGGGWKTFDNTKELLSHIAVEYGQRVLFDNRLLRSYLSDHASSSLPQGQRSLVGQSAVCGAVKILEDNLTSDPAHKEIAAKQAVQKMVDTYSTAKDAAERIVWEFTNALGWGLPEPKTQAIQPSTLGKSGVYHSQLLKNWWQRVSTGAKVLIAAATVCVVVLGVGAFNGWFSGRSPNHVQPIQQPIEPIPLADAYKYSPVETSSPTQQSTSESATENQILTETQRNGIRVMGISQPDDKTIAVGDSISIGGGALALPYNASNRERTFKSSNENVATIDNEYGIVTGISAGTSTITVTTVDGGYSASCVVTVVP